MSDANKVKVVCPICSGTKRVSWTAGDQTSSDPCGMCPDYATTGTTDLPTGWMWTTLAPGERSRIYREELDAVLDGFDYDAFRRLDAALEAIQVDDDEDDVADQVCTALRAALTSEAK